MGYDVNAAVFIVQSSIINKIEAAAFRYGGLSFTQLRMLGLIYSDAALHSVSQLAALLEKSPSLVSQDADLLETRGLIQRTLDNKDRRNVFLGPSIQGHSFYSEINTKICKELLSSSKAALDTVRSKYPCEIIAEEYHRLISYFDNLYTDLSPVMETYALREEKLSSLLKHHLSARAYHLLLIIGFNELPPSLKELASYMNVRQSTLSHTIRELANDGLIITSRRREDRRGIELTLTDKAQAIVKDCHSVLSQLFNVGFRPSDEDVELIYKFCDLICRG